MTTLKKIWRFLRSMTFAMILLGIMALVCVAGSLIPQGNAASYYQSAYSSAGAKIILALGLNDVFHCTWFTVLVVLLCLSLILCNLVRLPQLLKRSKSGFTLNARLREAAGEPIFETDASPEALLQEMGLHSLQRGDGTLYGVKNKAGIWGAWLCHLGMLILIIGFGFGQLTQFDASVYGIPGQTKPLEGTPYSVTIDDFKIDLRPDETVEQYSTMLTVTDLQTGETASATAAVNSPAEMLGMKFYQNSTGWGAGVTMVRGGETLLETFLCTGEAARVPDSEKLRVALRAFYPDYALDADGQPSTRSAAVKNPAYLYMLTYGEEVLGMRVLTGDEVITVDDLTIAFHDPQPYTLIEIKRDPLAKFALIGALLMIPALLLCFYLQPLEMWALRDAQTGRWRIYGKSRRGAEQLREDVQRAAGRTERRDPQ